jgi:hypothetical protein
LALAGATASVAASDDAGSAANISTSAAFLPAQHLFAPLTADPREVQIAVDYYRFEGNNEADVALGHSWGLARWMSTDGLWAWQWDIEGLAYSRFQLSSDINLFEAIDFFANLPIEVRRGIFSGKFMVYHESAHLGDDYIRSTGNTGSRYSVEGARGSVDVRPCRYLRLYIGGSLMTHTIPSQGPGMLQQGFEVSSPEFSFFKHNRQELYLAQDVQEHENVAWHPNSDTQVGMRFIEKQGLESMRVYFNYFTGHSPYGQFFRLPEHYAQIGIGFDF